MVEYGLIGRYISHSFSADIFNRKFAREGIDGRYSLFDLDDISKLPQLLTTIPNLKGLNVTSPYKRDVIPYLDYISEEAEALQAVNVIKIETLHDGTKRLKGFNTDCEGFRATLKELPAFSNALIFGTGGAASAVGLALEKQDVSFQYVSRNPKLGELDYHEVSLLLPDFRLIINATPLGMAPKVETYLPIDYDKIGASHICYDLIYNPPETMFLKMASAKGARTINGFQMLLNQASLSWDIWSESSSEK